MLDAAGGTVTAAASCLANGVLKATFGTKVKVAAVVLLALGYASHGGRVGASRSRAGPPAPELTRARAPPDDTRSTIASACGSREGTNEARWRPS